MRNEAIELADMIDRSEETTGFERCMASVIRSQAAEIERLKAELGDMPEAQAMLLRECKRKDALLREALDAFWVLKEHNALHFGEAHNTVELSRRAHANIKTGLGMT